MKKFASSWVAVAALSAGTAMACVAQQAGTSTAQGAQAPGAGSLPQKPAAQASPFPAVNPKNFTADSPTRSDVDAFLKALWGYEPNRIWQVTAIQKTRVPGMSRVTVLVADKQQAGRTSSTTFFTTPDGHHLLAGDSILDFGAKPFAETRALLQGQADGPAHGAAGKELMLVEFADLQCPYCRDAQSKMDNLAQDFPQARIVFENFPVESAHPFAMRAAELGECLRRSKGDAAFFSYAQTVFDMQSALTPDRGEATLAAAVTKAGGDPSAVAACAAKPDVKDKIESQMKLGTGIGVDQTPTLVVNGHVLPLANLSYEVLKRIVAYQAAQDGIEVKLQPTLSTLK